MWFEDRMRLGSNLTRHIPVLPVQHVVRQILHILNYLPNRKYGLGALTLGNYVKFFGKKNYWLPSDFQAENAGSLMLMHFIVKLLLTIINTYWSVQ